MRARVFGSLGAVLTLAAAAVLVRPDLADSLSGVVGVVESQDPKRLLLLLGSVVGAYATWAVRGSSRTEPAESGPGSQFTRVGDPPEEVSAADRLRTGESFDERVAQARSGDEDAHEAVRETLADAAVSAHARAADREAGRARRAVEAGEWTDDPVAAAFLGGEDGPAFPLLARLRAWLDPETERRRRLERTVDALDRVFDGDATENGGER